MDENYLYEQFLRIANLYVVRLDENLDLSGFTAREARRTKSKDTETSDRKTDKRRKDRRRQNKHRGKGTSTRKQRHRADTGLGTIDRVSDSDLSPSNPDNRKD